MFSILRLLFMCLLALARTSGQFVLPSVCHGSSVHFYVMAHLMVHYVYASASFRSGSMLCYWHGSSVIRVDEYGWYTQIVGGFL